MSRAGARRSPARDTLSKAARRVAAQRAARRRRILIGSIVAAGLVGALVFAATRPEPAALAAVETFPDQGQQHTDPAGPTPAYNSNPATSGPHAPQPAPCGIYRQEVPDVYAVHNLEHGAVVVQYGSGVADNDRAGLEEFARRAGTHILVAPRPSLEAQVVATAWTKLLRLDGFDESAIQSFYDRFAQAGPERGIPCPFQTDEAEG